MSLSAESIVIPRYLKIAVNLAARIASGEIPEGERLKGRSVLSTEYNVSPETIRRSMAILSDKGVVRILPGCGISVCSLEKAIQFVKSFKDDESLSDLRARIAAMMQERARTDEKIKDAVVQMIDLYKSRRSDLITPVEVTLPPDSAIIGHSIGAMQVWHNTGATIIGIIKTDKVIISPGPYYEFTAGDNILIVGDENVIARFNAFVSGVS